jgi:hypothetical protein
MTSIGLPDKIVNYFPEAYNVDPMYGFGFVISPQKVTGEYFDVIFQVNSHQPGPKDILAYSSVTMRARIENNGAQTHVVNPDEYINGILYKNRRVYFEDDGQGGYIYHNEYVDFENQVLHSSFKEMRLVQACPKKLIVEEDKSKDRIR